MKYYFVGIKGTGMSALAMFLKEKGHFVAGADTKDYIFTEERLKNNNVKIESFDDMNYQDFDFIVLGNSFSDMKIENKKTIKYPNLLEEIINDHISIAVAGTHGKTTTSTFLANMLNSNCLIGDGNSTFNNSPYFVFEACEYNRVFLNYHPDYLVITNIDYDHVDYYKTKEDYRNAFLEFISQVKTKVIVNGDDAFLRNIPNAISYGLSKNNNVFADNIKLHKKGITFDLYIDKKYQRTMNLNIYGKHNLLNVLACISVLYILGEKIRIKALPLAKRRFTESKYKNNIFIDDYGHHPNEIKATIDSIKQKYPNKKIVLIFKPDRYSRIKKFGLDFVEVFKMVDEAYITPFPTCSKKEAGIDIKDDYLSTLDESIILLKDDYSRFKNYQNNLFLMSSSKNVNTIKEGIIREMKK